MSNVSRRKFLGFAALVAAPSSLLLSRTAVAADLPHLDPADAAAKPLAYVLDASKLDAKTEPTFKAGSACGNCQLFGGKAGDAFGACGIFAGKAVSSKGWCRAYAKKAG